MSAHNAPHETKVTVRGSSGGFAQVISARSHRFVADEPIPNGGTDTGPTPYDLLLAALGS
jgi:putative redox protein